MQNSEEPNNWISNSFVSASEVGEGDSLSSFQSFTTPGSTAVDLQSNDQSLDVSHPKLSVGNEEEEEKTVEPEKSNTSATINVFEEDARSSWSEEPKQPELKETAVTDENSVSSQKSASAKNEEAEAETKREFPPENLFEYMWPQEIAGGEFFILQEQICDYLNVKSFKRKYPDLARRSADAGEKKFLKEKGVVTEMQCDLGLTALRSEEVLELMSKDYPDHYKEYIKVLRDKEQRTLSEKHKEYAASSSDKGKMVDLVKRAVQSAAEYNAHLNQERREERKSCMDLQTYTIHYPARGHNKVKKNSNTKPGKYPVALLPGQFQDYYKEYTPEELKYLPVNTVLYGPLRELNSIKALSDGSQSDSDDSTASDGSCSSSQGTHDDSSSGSEKPSDVKKSVNSPYVPKVKPNALCKVCKTGCVEGGKVREGKPEELVHCSDCDNSAHPSCVGLTSSNAVLKTYPWQCMDCKICSHCRDPNEEDKMLFCDVCDRGYHTFCVGLKALIPPGKWICRQCGSCSVCGVNRPGPESSKAQWQYETAKPSEADLKYRHPKLFCLSCFRKKR